MRIGIDARMLGKGYGLGRYVEQLILHINEIDSENEYVLFVQHEDVVNTLQIERAKFNVITADIPWYSWEEQVKFVPIIKKANVDLMHFPHWNVPLAYTEPFIVTIHDLTMYHYPRPEATTLGPLKFWIKDKVHRVVVKHAVQAAKHIITTSEFTKRDVHETLDVPLEKMTTVYQEPMIDVRNTKMLPTTGRDLACGLEKLRNYENFDRPYVLYVGAAYPHKNVEGLMEAWKIFEEKYEDDFQLVLVGKENEFWQRVLSNRTLEQSKKVHYLGFVPDEDLEIIYKSASLFVFPSLYEGFGLPPLEAMARGVPVASSNRSCLPEVLGEGTLYFDPENYEQMADVMHIGLTDEDVRFELKQNARENLKRFSWDQAAKQIVQLYASVDDL